MTNRRPYKYRLDGHTPVPVDDVLEWADHAEVRYEAMRHGLPDPWRVARHHLGPDGEAGWISTVFLGLDHQWLDGPPLLFETMTFTYNEKADRTYRTPTWDAALAMHDQVVAEVCAALGVTAHEAS